MTHHQPFSKGPKVLQTSPDTDSTRELLIRGSEELPQKPFNSGDWFRRDFIALVWRFLLTTCALGLLMICLWRFSGPRPLKKLEQRGFNTLQILLSGIASLGLGSLLGHLGSMLRWPLLARTMYQIQDVW